jgi:hypothetical protein
MSTAAVDAHTRSLVLSGGARDLSARPQARLNQPSLWHRLSFWPLEFLRLVAVVYMLPIVILAIGIPAGLALMGIVLGADWLWHRLW